MKRSPTQDALQPLSTAHHPQSSAIAATGTVTHPCGRRAPGAQRPCKGPSRGGRFLCPAAAAQWPRPGRAEPVIARIEAHQARAGPGHAARRENLHQPREPRALHWSAPPPACRLSREDRRQAGVKRRHPKPHSNPKPPRSRPDQPRFAGGASERHPLSPVCRGFSSTGIVRGCVAGCGPRRGKPGRWRFPVLWHCPCAWACHATPPMTDRCYSGRGCGARPKRRPRTAKTPGKTTENPGKNRVTVLPCTGNQPR